MEVVGAVGAVVQASTLAKKAWDLARRLEDVELRSCLLELRSSLNDAREQTEAVREENAQLRERLRHLEDRATVRDKLVAKGDGYYLREPVAGYPAPGPYCTACMDTRGELVLMLKGSGPFEVFGYTCKVCSMKHRRP